MKRTRALAAASLIGAAVTLIAFAGPAAANPNAINPIPGLNGTNGIPHLTGRTQAVAQQTGMLSPNRTQDANVLGTDLGIMWDNGSGEVLMAFGDTYGYCGVRGQQWRAVQPFSAGHIQVVFVDRDHLHLRRKFRENVVSFFRAGAVPVGMAINKNGIRAELGRSP